MWGVRGRALSHPDCPPSGRAAGAHYPLAVGAVGVRAWGLIINATARALASSFCALWGRHEGARGGRLLPGCGASGVGPSPTPDCPPSGRAAGAHHPLAMGAGGAGVGTRHQPHNARSCVLWGRLEGALAGAPLAWVWGVRGRALSHPRLPALWVGCRGPLPNGCGCGGVRAWGPVTNHTARALASWLCTLWGRHEGARGGRLLPGCGASGSGALPLPTARPLGGLLGPTTHWLWVRGLRAWGPGCPCPRARNASPQEHALWDRYWYRDYSKGGTAVQTGPNRTARTADLRPGPRPAGTSPGTPWD